MAKNDEHLANIWRTMANISRTFGEKWRTVVEHLANKMRTFGEHLATNSEHLAKNNKIYVPEQEICDLFTTFLTGSRR